MEALVTVGVAGLHPTLGKRDAVAGIAGGSDDLRIDFTVHGNGGPVRAAGWSDAEPDGTWSLGTESRLVLPAPTQPATYVLVLTLRPMIADDRLPAQRLRVAVNDAEVAEFRIGRRTTRICLIPWPVVRRGKQISIVLGTPDAARPADFGLGNDRRRLGVNLASLRLYPDLHGAVQDEAMLGSDAPVPVDAAAVMAVEQMKLHDLMLKFESLGQNCEFGLVQRRCQAEPLGLLRFSSTPLPRLLDALDARLAGLGAPETTSVALSPNGREYMVKDSRFGFVSHAWVNAGAMDPEDIMRREVRRVPILARKLVEDLEGGDKIFVFKGMGTMAEEEVFPLALAIRRYGPNRLLLVNLADAEHRAGTVEARAPGFMVGYLDRFAPGNNAHDLSFGSWVQVCRAAYRLRLIAEGMRR